MEQHADPSPPHATLDFRVMGTNARILLRHDDSTARPHLEWARGELERLSAKLTRFDPTSELERLNDAGGGVIDDELHDLLSWALRLHRATGGRFDVGVGAQMVAAGYDRTFDTLDGIEDARAQLATTMHDAAPRAAAPSTIPPFELNAATVAIRDGIRIDLGGLAKGWAADQIATKLARDSGRSALVSLGGDIAVQVVDDDVAWPVGARTSAEERITIGLAYGGLATSGWERRAWRSDRDGSIAHHVIDPATGRPATTDVARITVIGPSCTEAEAWATALMLVGSTAAAEEADALGLTTIIVAADGTSRLTGALA